MKARSFIALCWALCFLTVAPSLHAQFKTGGIELRGLMKVYLATCSGGATDVAVLCYDATADKLQVSNNNGSFSDVITNNRSTLMTLTGALKVSGAIGSGYRTDAQIELTGTDGILSIAQTTAPGNTTNESAIAFMANDSASAAKKTASISSRWISTNATTGYGVARMNATSGGGGTDNVSQCWYGAKGVLINPSGVSCSNAEEPGSNIIRLAGSGYTQIIQTGTTISGNFKEFLDARDNTSTYGLLFGYESGTSDGVISAPASNGVAIWTFNGSTWGERLKVKTSGSVTLLPQAMTAGTMTATNSAEVRTTVHRYDWTNAMVTALGAVTAGDVSVCTLPAKTVIKNAYVVITSAAGTVTTLTVAVGRTGAAYIDYIPASDAKAAANTVYGDASGERGTNLTGYDLPSFTGTTTVNAHFISTGGNLSAVTTSTGSVYIETETLP